MSRGSTLTRVGGLVSIEQAGPGFVRVAVTDAGARIANAGPTPVHKAADRWDRDRASVDHAMDMRGETYWSM